jgi:hypothetical protein
MMWNSLGFYCSSLPALSLLIILSNRNADFRAISVANLCYQINMLVVYLMMLFSLLNVVPCFCYFIGHKISKKFVFLLIPLTPIPLKIGVLLEMRAI